MCTPHKVVKLPENVRCTTNGMDGLSNQSSGHTDTHADRLGNTPPQSSGDGLIYNSRCAPLGLSATKQVQHARSLAGMTLFVHDCDKMNSIGSAHPFPSIYLAYILSGALALHQWWWARSQLIRTRTRTVRMYRINRGYGLSLDYSTRTDILSYGKVINKMPTHFFTPIECTSIEDEFRRTAC